MRSSTSAAIGVVSKLVNMHATLGAGVIAGDVVGDGGWGGLGRLLEGDGPRNLGVSAEDGNYERNTLGQSGGRNDLICLKNHKKNRNAGRGRGCSGAKRCREVIRFRWRISSRYECAILRDLWVFVDQCACKLAQLHSHHQLGSRLAGYRYRSRPC